MTSRSPWWSRTLLKVRPAPLASWIKRAVHAPRSLYLTDDGAHFWLDPVSQFAQALRSPGGYEPALTRWLRTALRPGDVFVDAGAHEGYFSVIAGHAEPRVRTIAIEPQSRLHTVLEANARANGLSLELVPYALGARRERRPLFLFPDLNPGASGFVRPPRFAHPMEWVDVVPFDDVLAERAIRQVRVWKIDCEGFEDEILAGAAQSLAARRIDFLAIDFHPHLIGQKKAERARQRLLRFGYVPQYFDDLTIYAVRA